MDARKRWLALYVLCAGELMIVLDTTMGGALGLAMLSAALLRPDNSSERNQSWVCQSSTGK